MKKLITLIALAFIVALGSASAAGSKCAECCKGKPCSTCCGDKCGECCK